MSSAAKVPEGWSSVLPETTRNTCAGQAAASREGTQPVFVFIVGPSCVRMQCYYIRYLGNQRRNHQNPPPLFFQAPSGIKTRGEDTTSSPPALLTPFPTHRL